MSSFLNLLDNLEISAEDSLLPKSTGIEDDPTPILNEEGGKGVCNIWNNILRKKQKYLYT